MTPVLHSGRALTLRDSVGISLQEDGVLTEPDGGPERSPSGITGEYVEHESPAGQHLTREQLQRVAADPLPPARPHDEEMTQVGAASFVIAEQGVRDDLLVRVKQHGLVLGGQPDLHPVLELGHVHDVAVAFIRDELMVQLRQTTNIC